MLGNAIKQYRNKRNMTQQELATSISCSIDSVRRWEANLREPRVSELKKLCEVLGCTETELLNEKSSGKVEVLLSWNWDEMKKGEINMSENKFKLILGEDGMIGLHGAGMLTSREAIDEFLSRVREQLEIGLDAQIKRGAVQGA